MIMPVCNINDADATVLAAEQDRFRDAFSLGPIGIDGAVIASVYWQSFSKNENPGDADACLLLAGRSHLTETLCGMAFQLSPLSFFQVTCVVLN
jgi:hypothetical protein